MEKNMQLQVANDTYNRYEKMGRNCVKNHNHRAFRSQEEATHRSLEQIREADHKIDDLKQENELLKNGNQELKAILGNAKGNAYEENKKLVDENMKLMERLWLAHGGDPREYGNPNIDTDADARVIGLKKKVEELKEKLESKQSEREEEYVKELADTKKEFEQSKKEMVKAQGTITERDGELKTLKQRNEDLQKSLQEEQTQKNSHIETLARVRDTLREKFGPLHPTGLANGTDIEPFVFKDLPQYIQRLQQEIIQNEAAPKKLAEPEPTWT
jgi:DNA repair exonuclease SbcCD ATPase subunit